MAKKVSDLIWKEHLDKFSSYKGTVTSFCKENSISKSQFYYYKKRFEIETSPAFQAISFEEEKDITLTTINTVKNKRDVRIEIGKANVYIPANEIALLSELLKELAKSC